ncbi:hypothetical protein TWF696_004375 [Orbilia brochopaga]|uniref:Uncharacterized protein n=1 Tax=Orbilia brochopaga TaxID=3140254 RepID=A0AAV9V6R4_9PEZI
MYKKHIVNPGCPTKGSSLLTRAIISDSEAAAAQSTSIYSRVAFRVPRRGMSTTSTVSTASVPSTADLTSDAGDSSSSELSSPSPRAAAPMFALPLVDNHVVAIKGHSDDELHKQQTDPNAVVAALGRKRCITFACPAAPPPPKVETKVEQPVLKLEQPTPVRRQTTLKFACNVKDENKAPKKPHSPPPKHSLSRAVHLAAGSHHRRDSSATVVDEKTSAKAIPLVSSVSSVASIPRFYEFASSVDDSVHSWMNAPQFPSRLLKVDCLLEKEKEIQKLSEGVDEDEDQQEDDNDDHDNLEPEDDDSEDDGYKEDEEDDEYEWWSDSDEGNRTDDEDGFAESDDEDEDFEHKIGTAIPDRQADRPTCCRNTSDSSFASGHHTRKPGLCSFQRERRVSIRPRTPELPDSTDFVPGTLDEDKVLEDYYLSCMEERKSMNKVVRPQDIDPSFPTDDEDDNDEEDEEDERPRGGRRRGSIARQSSASRSPPSNARRLRSPPPIPRRGSRGMSPNKRRPSFTARSPPPPGRVGRLRLEFDNNRSSLARSTSLPRHGLRRKVCMTTSTSPKPSKAIPLRQRGALDIVKGLERKRMRRREHIYGRPREYRAEAGEGVERMREIGMMNKERVGANPAPKWMISV